jgi:hypothetical protein
VQIFQRPDWYGSPVDLGELSLRRKDRRQTKCLIRTHQLGWELRLVVGSQLEIVQTQVCRSQTTY